MAKKKTKPSRWITQEQVRTAAKNLRSALKMSHKHWEQIAQATEKQIERAIANNKLDIRCRHCALCHFYHGDNVGDLSPENCKKCVLSNHHSSKQECCREWHACANCCKEKEWGNNSIATVDYKKFHKAAGKMRDKLARILKAIES